MTSPSSTMSPTGLCLRGGPGGVAIGNPHYLYGRPLNMVTGGQGSGQLNMTGRLTNNGSTEISSSCPSSTIKTNLPLPIHSDETITGTETGAETSEESHNGLTLLGMYFLKYTWDQNVWHRWPVYEAKCLCSRGHLILMI